LNGLGMHLPGLGARWSCRHCIGVVLFHETGAPLPGRVPRAIPSEPTVPTKVTLESGLYQETLTSPLGPMEPVILPLSREPFG